jgi:hypothetical protein
MPLTTEAPFAPGRQWTGIAARPWWWAVVLVFGLAAVSLRSAAESTELSEAEIEIFMKDRLGALEPPTRLHYRVKRRGSLQPEFDQSADLTLTSDDGRTTSQVSYLSGEQRLDLPSIGNPTGNPILLHFLEREVRELSRLTGGSTNYYRKRMRMALANHEQVVDTRIDVGERSVPARLIRIRPYHDDPARARYEKFANRYYEMAFSEQVPGGIVRLHAELRADEADDSGSELLWAETVSFDREEHPGDT